MIDGTHRSLNSWYVPSELVYMDRFISPIDATPNPECAISDLFTTIRDTDDAIDPRQSPATRTPDAGDPLSLRPFLSPSCLYPSRVSMSSVEDPGIPSVYEQKKNQEAIPM